MENGRPRASTDDRNAAGPCPRAVNLMIVAGPSGSGKTTFIEQLHLGVLDPAIRRRLPEACETWPVVGVTRARSEAVEEVARWAKCERKTGLILHYDNSYIYRTGEAAHEHTGAKELFLVGSYPMVVSMRPSLEQLRHQFQQRLQKLRAGKSKLRILWREEIRIPVRKVLQRIGGQPGVDIRDLHRSSEWLADCNAKWDALVESLKSSFPELRSLDVEPYNGPTGPSFRLREIN